MEKDDKIIDEFFSEMKEADSGIEIPEFDSLIVKKKWRLKVAAVAASLILIAVSGWYLLTRTRESASIEIVVMEVSSEGDLSVMTHDETIEEWKSPTQSLINDF